MFDDFWKDAEVISIYSDQDAIDDGVLIDISYLNIYFNGKLINRLTDNCNAELGLLRETRDVAKYLLAKISANARLDDSWGIVEKFGGKTKLWLIPNEVRGYTLMLPSCY